jgi:hypothetical protein
VARPLLKAQPDGITPDPMTPPSTRRQILTATALSPLLALGCSPARQDRQAPLLSSTEDPMITLRRASERGHANHGWLDSHHTFSFADYYDPRHMGFRKLRVINEDRVQPGRGFGTHPHQNMEILSCVLEGGLEHKDSMGTGSVIRPGDVQRMTAGTGVTHSEFNASRSEQVHFLQIWVMPERAGLTPSYEQKTFSASDKQGKLRLVASRDGREGSVVIHQDLSLYATLLGAGEQVTHTLAPGRHAWVHVARGEVKIGDRKRVAGDAAAVSDEASLALDGVEGGGEVLLFDMA